MNGFDLREGLFRELPRLEQEKLGVADHRGECVVDAVLHVRHVAAQGGVVFVARGVALRLASQAQSLRPAQGFAGNEQKRLCPIFAQRDVHEPWIFAAQLPHLAGIGRHAENHSGGRLEGAQDIGELAVAQRADHDQVMREHIVIFPEVAAQHGDSWRLPFGAPARGQQPRKFCFVGED